MTRLAHIQLGITPEFDRLVWCNLPRPEPQWYPTQVAALFKHWEHKTDEELAQMFGCSVDRVVKKRNTLGLHRKRPITTNELRHVEANYLLSNYADIAEDLHRSPESVRYMVKAYINKR